MFRGIFDSCISLDQGYYTAQPATVEQVQHLFRHVALLRDELGRFMVEVQQYPDSVETLTEKTKALESRIDSVSKRLDSAMNNITANKDAIADNAESIAALAVDVKKLTSDMLTLFATSGKDSTLTLTLSNSEGKNIEKTITFTSPDIATTVSEDGSTITQKVTALNADVHATKWGLKPHGGGVAVTYGGKVVHTFTVDSVSIAEEAADAFLDTSTLALSMDDNVIKFTLDSSKAAKAFQLLDDGLSALAADAVTDVKLTTEVSGDKRSVDFALTTEDGGVPTVQRITVGVKNELTVSPVDDGSGFIIEALDQLERIEPFQYDRVHFDRDNREIAIDTQEMRSDNTKHWKPSEEYNRRTIRLAGSSSEGLLSVDWAANDTISIDDSVMRAYVDNKEVALKKIISDQADMIRELNGRIATLETMRTESITDARMIVEPVSHDILKVTLEKSRTDGTKDLDSVMLKFTNIDHALRYTISEGANSDTANVGINIDKKWLTRQGLEPDMETI